MTFLGQFSDPCNPPEIAETFIDNANRPDVLANMTMNEYKKMRKEGDEWIISVMNHKTVHVHGPAYVVLSSKLKSWLSIFVNYITSQVVSSGKDHVFLRWNGQTIKSSQIKEAIQSLFKKPNLKMKITSTSF